MENQGLRYGRCEGGEKEERRESGEVGSRVVLDLSNKSVLKVSLYIYNEKLMMMIMVTIMAKR